MTAQDDDEEPVRLPADFVGRVLFASELASRTFVYLVVSGALPREHALRLLDEFRLNFEFNRNAPDHRAGLGYDQALLLIDQLENICRETPSSPPRADPGS